MRERRLHDLLLAAASLVAFVLLLLLAELVARGVRPDELEGQPQAGLSRLHRYSEVYGWELRPGVRALVDGQRTTINRLGQRGPEVPRARTGGRARLLMLGDSIAFGYGVADEETFSARLQQAGFEVVNMAVPGYGTDQELLRLQHEGLPWRPDVVLLHYCLENDGVDNVSPRFFYDDVHPKPYFVLEGGRLVLHDAHVRLSPLARGGLWLRERSYLLNWLWPRPALHGGDWRRRKAAVLADEHAALQLTLALVARAAQASVEGGARFLLVVHPNRESYHQGSPWADALLGAPLPQGARVLDMAAAYHARGLRFHDVTLEPIGHLSRPGHARAADIMAEALRR